MSAPKAIEIGQRFGKLVVIGKAAPSASGNLAWSCVCDCGNKTNPTGTKLRRGDAMSCGCVAKDRLATANDKRATHRLTHSAEYQCWRSMRARCQDANHKQYFDYGGRGIRVCDEWSNSFEAFFRDMGPRPSDKHSIDRIDNNGNYEPSNCRWAVPIVQQNNRRNNVLVEVGTETLTVSQLSRKTGVPYSTLRDRLSARKPANRPRKGE